jgi:hypothetical protein
MSNIVLLLYIEIADRRPQTADRRPQTVGRRHHLDPASFLDRRSVIPQHSSAAQRSSSTHRPVDPSTHRFIIVRSQGSKVDRRQTSSLRSPRIPNRVLDLTHPTVATQPPTTPPRLPASSSLSNQRTRQTKYTPYIPVVVREELLHSIKSHHTTAPVPALRRAE